MQRQSLGSPVSKLHGHGGMGVKDDAIIVEDDSKRKDLPSPSLIDYDDEDHKATKPRRFTSPSSPLSSSHSKPEKLVHLIPFLTLVCFLVLYLVSHNPSQSDLAQFNGFKRSSKHIDSADISDVGRFTDLRKGDVLAIRSIRNLKEITYKRSGPKSRSHRKIADF